MGVFLANGTRQTKSGLTRDTPADPLQVVHATLYTKKRWDNDPTADGEILEVLAEIGTELRRSVIDGWFPAPTIDTVSPATGAAAGGTTVTLTGENLDGVTSVTFGGTAATSVSASVLNNEVVVTCVTPAKTAGAYNVVLISDGGSVTKTSGFTYT